MRSWQPQHKGFAPELSGAVNLQASGRWGSGAAPCLPPSCSPLFLLLLFLKSVKAKTPQKRRPREAVTRWASRYHFSGDKPQRCCTFCLLAPQRSRTRFSARKGSQLSQDPQLKHSDNTVGSPPDRPSTARAWRAPGSPQSILSRQSPKPLLPPPTAQNWAQGSRAQEAGSGGTRGRLGGTG